MPTIIKVKKINSFFDSNYKINFDKVSIYSNNIKTPKKILIIKWGGMGDIIISTAVINDLLNFFNKSKVDINTMPSWKDIFHNDLRINRVWGFYFGRGIKKIFSILKWITLVKKNKYDLIIDLQTNDTTRLILTCLRYIFFYKCSLIGNHETFPYTIKNNRKTNLNSQPIHLLHKTIVALGIRPKTFSPKVFNTKQPSYINKLFKLNNLINNEFVVLIPGSSQNNKLKRWGAKNFTKLAKLIIDKNYKIILVGGPEDIQECNNIYNQNENIINLCNKIKLLDLLFIFRKSKLIVSNDTGPAHLVAATNSKMIQITGPTNPEIVKPYGKNIIAIQSEIECKNCYKKICAHHSCMKGITPEYMFSIIKEKI